MMPVRVTFTYNWDPKEKMRGLPGKLKEALKAAAEHWYKNFLPRHFQHGAAAMYGYAPRSPAYLRFKSEGEVKIDLGRFGTRTFYSNDRGGTGNPDLVFTGRLRDACQKYRHVTASVQGGAARVTSFVKMHVGHLRSKKTGLNYATFNRIGGPNLQDEITTVTAAEAAKLRDVMQAVLMPWLRQQTVAQEAKAFRGYGEGSLGEVVGGVGPLGDLEAAG